MPSGPAALPDFKDLMALLTSALVGRLAFTSSWFAAGEMSGGTCGGGLLRISWKCSAHLALSDFICDGLTDCSCLSLALRGPCSSLTVSF